MRARARAYVDAVPGAGIVPSDAYVGGGALAQERIASIAVAIQTEQPDFLAARLRDATPPVVARIGEGHLLLDLRTIAPEEDRTVIAALKKLVTTP